MPSTPTKYWQLSNFSRHTWCFPSEPLGGLLLPLVQKRLHVRIVSHEIGFYMRRHSLSVRQRRNYEGELIQSGSCKDKIRTKKTDSVTSKMRVNLWATQRQRSILHTDTHTLALLRMYGSKFASSFFGVCGEKSKHEEEADTNVETETQTPHTNHHVHGLNLKPPKK